VRAELQRAFDAGVRSCAVALMHAYAFPDHERAVGAVARAVGFEQVSLSSDLIPMVKLVPRGLTACVDAYLTPCIRTYLATFTAGFDAALFQNARVHFMQSDGGLAPVDAFFGFRAILSGPAGGVVGYAQTAYERQPVAATGARRLAVIGVRICFLF
jgi:5-oxoprolinase (ATP-hydrolysing)